MSALIRSGEAVFPHLLDAAWKAATLIVLAFVLCKLLGERRLALRYWLCVCSLVGILVLPAASFIAKDHPLALFPATERPATFTNAFASSKRSPVDVATSRVAEPTGRASPSEVPAAETAPQKPATEPAALDESASNVTPETPTTASRSGAQRPPAQSIPATGAPFPWVGLSSLTWLAVCIFFLVRLFLAGIAAVRLRRSSVPAADPALRRLFDEAKQAAGFKTKAELRIGKSVASPVSIGVFRPTILLPESLPREMPPDQLRPILLHELAHVRLGDYAVNMLQRFAEAVLFYHPFVYLLNRRLRRLREEVCDNWVLNRFSDAIAYARALTGLAERWISPRKNLVGIGLFSRPVRLSRRIERILASGKRLSTALGLKTALILLAFSLSAVGALSLTTLSARATKPEKKESVEKKEAVKAPKAAPKGDVISWKDDAVYRDGKPYAKIVQWEPEADLPMIAFGDQNNNGKTDTWIRFLNGKPLRIEIDSNEDRRIDKWEHYFDGVIDLVEVDRDFNRKVDLWQVYDKGKLFREEIDTNADGSVDKWLEVDEQGNKVEKEIVSWVVRDWLEVRSDPGTGAHYRPADSTFFNAADRVEKIELKPRSEAPAASSPGPSPSAAPPPGQPQFRLRPLTGCRVEYMKEVDANKVVAGWFHESPLRGETPCYVDWGDTVARPGQNNPVRHLAVDIGFDGGVDSWGQVAPPISEMPRPESGRRRAPIFNVLCDDTNRDGKADRVYVVVRQDPSVPRLRSETYQTDSDGDGLVDWLGGHGWDPRRPFRLDADHDGIFESFDPQWRVSPLIEATGTSSLRIQLKVSAGPDPLPLLCTLTIPGVREGVPYTRSFWLVPGETVTVPKLSRGPYDLSVSIGGSYRAGDYGVTTFSYPGFLLLEKGQSLSKTLTWDSRPVFRGRLISAEAKPLAGQTLEVYTPGASFASVSLTSDSAGDFELFNIPPGRYTLSVRPDPREFREAIEVLPAGEKEPERQLFLTSLSGPDWKIPPGWEAPVAISGKVLSHDGQPLPNMLVKVSSVTKEKISRAAVTGLDGSYHVFALLPGIYSVAIYNNDFPQQRTSLEDFQVQIDKTPAERDFRLSAPLPVVIEQR